jgi:V/A-type H+-transporting ATPase subunit I
MFTPERMHEINLFIDEDAIQAVVLTLAGLGTLHIAEESATPRPNQFHWESIGSTYADQERRLRELLDLLGLDHTDELVPTDLNMEQDHTFTSQLLAEVRPILDNWRNEREATQQALEQARFLTEQLRLLKPLDVQVEWLMNLNALRLRVGTIPTNNLERIQTSLFRIPFVIIPSFNHAGRTLVFAATTSTYVPILDRALQSIFFQPITLPDNESGSPAEVLAHAEQQLRTAQSRLAEIQLERQRLSERWGKRLKQAYHHVRACRSLAETIQRLPLQGRIYVIAGWVPVRRFQELIDAVQDVTHGKAVIEVLEPDSRRHTVPTQLHNPNVLRSFEPLVTNFGVPGYDEIDPTLIVGLTFLVMYGVMFGDVGHGLLLTMAGLGLYLSRNTLSNMSPLLGAAGLSSTFFGFCYGTVLGMPLLPALWLRPTEHITVILLATLAAGAVLINIGFALYVYTHWRNRNWQNVLLDRNGIAGLALYWILLGGGIGVWQGLIAPGIWIGLALVPTTLLALHEPIRRWIHERRFQPGSSWGEYAVLAFFEIFETIISFAGNSLSFVRLGAFAVAHEGLSRVVLLIADLSGGLGWLTMLLGTVFVVGFEGLIVGIQTLRLEYYEFFGRFFRGDGRAFKPLQIRANDQV